MSLIRRIIVASIALIVLLVGILFSIHNNQMVSVDYLLGKTPEFYLSFWLICAFVVGGLLGVAVSSTTIIRLKAGERSSQRKIRRSESEITRLKGESV